MSEVFIYPHGGGDGEIISKATDDVVEEINDNIDDFDESHLTMFLEYWTEYHPSETQIINFLKTNNIVKCGTIESIGLDVFYVEEK